VSAPALRIGIDLGGTKIEGIALDGGGATAARARIATPRGDYDATVAAIAGLVSDLESSARAEGTVGIGMPGTISPATGLVKNANSTWLNGRPLQGDLERALARPVRLANDANCFALSEAADGSGAGASVVFGVILGTGVGGAIVANGALLPGANAIAGEWGHVPLPWMEPGEFPGPRCWCGRRGCIETFLSGPARSEIPEGASEIYHSRLARALALVVNVIDPDVIVLGGGLSKIEGLYEAVPRLWSRWIFSDRVATRLLPPRHGDAGGVRGAAWLWPVRTTW
jgi:fructokinase